MEKIKSLLSKRRDIDRAIMKRFRSIATEIRQAVSQSGLQADLAEIYFETGKEYMTISVAMKMYNRTASKEDFMLAITEVSEKYKKDRDGVSIEVTYC